MLCCAVLSRSVASDWSGLPCPPSGDLPKVGIEPKSPALQVDSLLSESPGKPKITGVDNLSLLQGIFLTQESKRGLLHCRQILYQWATREALHLLLCCGIYIVLVHHNIFNFLLSLVYFIFIYLFIYGPPVVCGILVPQSRMNQRPLAVEAESPKLWDSREVPQLHI